MWPLLAACTPTIPIPPPTSGGSHSAEAHSAATTGATLSTAHTATATTGLARGTADTGEIPPADRDRLLLGYLDHLRVHPDRRQTNGLRGADLADVCDLWGALDQSSQATFLTLTARLEGSILGSDGSTMLSHVTTAYRVVGGQGATGADPGSCGGGEFNRMIVSIDPALHEALRQAHANQGGPGRSGGPDVADLPPGGVWRDSHDAAGPHEPFTMSCETEDGAPRGQVQLFRDPYSPVASAPLGRLDLEDLVDPWALEMDHDYDCFHNSNPTCIYTLYGPLCLPQAPRAGVAIYTDGYGSFDRSWRPAGC